VQVKDHVLLPWATELEAVDEAFRAVLTPARIQAIVSLIPDEWLTGEWQTETPDEIRQVYTDFLKNRVASSRIFINEATHARTAIV
jgi:hypothetical protein